MCSRNDDPTTYDAPKKCSNPDCKCMKQKLLREKPWDHPYESTSNNICIHCGLVGSYAHTSEYYGVEKEGGISNEWF